MSCPNLEPSQVVCSPLQNTGKMPLSPGVLRRSTEREIDLPSHSSSCPSPTGAAESACPACSLGLAPQGQEGDRHRELRQLPCAPPGLAAVEVRTQPYLDRSQGKLGRWEPGPGFPGASAGAPLWYPSKSFSDSARWLGWPASRWPCEGSRCTVGWGSPGTPGWHRQPAGEVPGWGREAEASPCSPPSLRGCFRPRT